MQNIPSLDRILFGTTKKSISNDSKNLLTPDGSTKSEINSGVNSTNRMALSIKNSRIST
jgi:hypothetical protein